MEMQQCVKLVIFIKKSTGGKSINAFNITYNNAFDQLFTLGGIEENIHPTVLACTVVATFKENSSGDMGGS